MLQRHRVHRSGHWPMISGRPWAAATSIGSGDGSTPEAVCRNACHVCFAKDHCCHLILIESCSFLFSPFSAVGGVKRNAISPKEALFFRTDRKPFMAAALTRRKFPGRVRPDRQNAVSRPVRHRVAIRGGCVASDGRNSPGGVWLRLSVRFSLDGSGPSGYTDATVCACSSIG